MVGSNPGFSSLGGDATVHPSRSQARTLGHSAHPSYLSISSAGVYNFSNISICVTHPCSILMVHHLSATLLQEFSTCSIYIHQARYSPCRVNLQKCKYVHVHCMAIPPSLPLSAQSTFQSPVWLPLALSGQIAILIISLRSQMSGSYLHLLILDQSPASSRC